jgi:hypothetical protein
MSQGIYLFCLARLSRLPSLPLKWHGLNGQSPLEAVSFQDLAAVWSPVPLEDFCGSDADDRMGDLTWIGPRVIRHQEVVTGVMRYSPVLPARFGTIFSSSANLLKVLRHHHDTIAGFLEDIEAREEWAVKGLLDRSQAKEKVFARKLAREAERLEALSPGKRYFEEQRLRIGTEKELQQWLTEACRRLVNELRDHAAQVRQRRLLSLEATGSDKEMVLNWAFLVPAESVPGFQALIQDANARYAGGGLIFEGTGP